MKNLFRTLTTLALVTALLSICVAASAEGIYGTYTYTQDVAGFSDVVQGAGEQISEVNQLMLFNAPEGKTTRNETNAYAWQEGDNYILVKNLTIGDMGMNNWAVYYGSFDTDDNGIITLNTPAYYSYYVFFGNCAADEVNGYMFLDQAGFNLFTADNEYYNSNGDAGERDGLYDFNNPIADYHHAAGGEAAFQVKLDQDGRTYEYYNSDDDE